jgi:hypothetical protein
MRKLLALRLSWLFPILIACGHASAYTAERAVYVSDPTPLLGDADQFAGELAAHQFAVVIAYKLAALLGDSRLAPWIDKLHAHGLRVYAPIGGTKGLDGVNQFIAAHPGTYFDGLVTEYEFWNHKADRAQSFAELLALVKAMRDSEPTWSHGHPAKVGVYLGYPTHQEAHQLAPLIDFAFLNYSVKTAVGAFDHMGAVSYADRWALFAMLPEYPIFYSNGEVDMRASLAETNGMTTAETLFEADAKPQPTGFVYFTWESLPK